jgi:hypothetical protein
MTDLEVKILEWMKGKIWQIHPDNGGWWLSYGVGSFNHYWYCTSYCGKRDDHTFSDEFHNMVSQMLLPYYPAPSTTLDYLNKEFGIENNH